MSFPLMPVANPTSEPGVSWEAIGGLGASIDMEQLSVSDEGVWVAARKNATGKVLRSTSYGSTWLEVSTGSTDINGSIGSAYGEGLFAVTDFAGNGIYSSPEGTSWTLRQPVTNRDNFRANYNDGYFVVGSGTGGGNGFIFASADGITWVYGVQGAVGANSATCGIYVAALGRTFAGGNEYKYVNAIPTSATVWTGTPTGLSGRITDVAWSPTAARAVVTGPSGIYSSDNLITWTLRQSATSMLGVSWCGTQFVAVGSLGKLYTSPDGLTWTLRTTGTTASLYGAAERNGAIIVVGYGGTVLISS